MMMTMQQCNGPEMQHDTRKMRVGDLHGGENFGRERRKRGGKHQDDVDADPLHKRWMRRVRG